MLKKLYLLCNAHIDPVWMWEQDEGMAEVLSTYRVAADFCEEYEDFLFNHNEAVLYEWVEELDPQLFARIQKLVKEGKWRIIGRLYIQPDCNLPSGEAMVRQILAGRNYFYEKFAQVPETAFNVDSFGHARSLVQILKLAGYNSYITCRPSYENCPLPADDFIWRDATGAELLCHHGYDSYESHRGEADLKIQGYMDNHSRQDTGMVLWGIGNHGGGPSRIDYEKIEVLRKKYEGQCQIFHTYPEEYFKTLEGKELPVVEKSLRYHAVGCYTSQVRIKQKYRHLENMLFKVEKMASCAAVNGVYTYPVQAFMDARQDMIFAQFHDILPGSSIAAAEDAACRQLDHGIELMERVKIRSFLSLLRGEEKAENGTIPIFVFNPHPREVDTVVECEFSLPDQNKDSKKWSFPRVYCEGKAIPCQAEHEASNFNVDWRKKVVFRTKLKPFAMNRFTCKIELWDEEPVFESLAEGEDFRFKTEDMELVINGKTGGIDKYTVGGVDYLKPGSCVPLVLHDDYDSWGNTTREFRRVEGSFQLMSPEEGTDYSGIAPHNRIPSLRLIEDGEVRSVVEAVMKYNRSYAVIRYYLPKKGTQIRIGVNLVWNEKMKMLKLPLCTSLEGGRYIGQQMFGREELACDGTEMVAQKWVALEKDGKALTLINNGSYGSDCCGGEIRASLLRSPGYSAGCSDFSRRKAEVMEQGRCNAFIDQGERSFTFWLRGGETADCLNHVDMEADVANESIFALSCFTGEKECEVKAPVIIDNPKVQLSAFKRSEDDKAYILRLFETTGEGAECRLSLPVSGISQELSLRGFEILTLKYEPAAGMLEEVPLMERDFS